VFSWKSLRKYGVRQSFEQEQGIPAIPNQRTILSDTFMCLAIACETAIL